VVRKGIGDKLVLAQMGYIVLKRQGQHLRIERFRIRWSLVSRERLEH